LVFCPGTHSTDSKEDIFGWLKADIVRILGASRAGVNEDKEHGSDSIENLEHPKVHTIRRLPLTRFGERATILLGWEERVLHCGRGVENGGLSEEDGSAERRRGTCRGSVTRHEILILSLNGSNVLFNLAFRARLNDLTEVGVRDNWLSKGVLNQG
jgi:hypothetical protein